MAGRLPIPLRESSIKRSVQTETNKRGREANNTELSGAVLVFGSAEFDGLSL